MADNDIAYTVRVYLRDRTGESAPGDPRDWIEAKDQAMLAEVLAEAANSWLDGADTFDDENGTGLGAQVLMGVEARDDIGEAEAKAFAAGSAGQPLPAAAGVPEQAAWARGRDASEQETGRGGGQ